MKNINFTLSMKMPGKKIFMGLCCMLITVSSYSQSVTCKYEATVPANMFIDAPLREVYYIDYALYENSIDSAIYLVKELDTLSPEAFISHMHASVFLEQSKIKLIRRITFEQNYNIFSVVKYSIIKSDGLSEIRSVQLQLKDGAWKDVGLDFNKDIVYVFMKLKPNAFWCFYSKADDTPCGVINTIKVSAKNYDGTLNIGKLEAVIKKNNSTLSSYLD
jgi:hypothetical protein